MIPVWLFPVVGICVVAFGFAFLLLIAWLFEAHDEFGLQDGEEHNQ